MPPDEDPFAALTWFERFAFRVMRFWNQGAGARVGYYWQRYFVVPLVGAVVSRRLTIIGLEKMKALPRNAPILLVANHRTFFDLFILGWIAWKRGDLEQSLNFPVRANFFYESPLGLFVLLTMSGGTMFPPFVRAAEKKAFNRYSVDVVVEKMKSQGQLVGFHPEGTRSKTDDPYTLLPAQPGAGIVALRAQPTVLPAFVNGLTNSMWGEIKENFRRGERRRVIVVLGDPIDISGYPADTRLSHHKRCADLFVEKITALGAEEKAARAALEAEA